ncbi:PIN domain-containing protein [Ferroplasma acidiphilum]|jgi:tRNA(fMet)-specific endonuclease VapC|uniref:PIN domain-containing protein n=1 Tax=Ferroplasma acidiphilum TaxID=74969 RepID=UPI0023F2BE1D|nr:PIN domain-containing protein [Ferroplasma acidiphilum]
MIVIDTNVVIEYLKGNEIIIQTVNEYSKNYGIGITYISEYELLKYSDKKNKVLEEFIKNITVLYPDNTSAARSAEIFIKLRSSGDLINENDILIAGIALKNNNKFITLDSDFNKIKDENIDILQI